MTSSEFVQELRDKVRAFCATLDERPPAYSYVPLKTDEERVQVMKSRLWNELRAADLFGGWLKTTPEIEVKTMMARSAAEEMVHAGLLSARIRELGADPFDYRPLPAQMSMFNAMEGLRDSCQRLAGFSMGGEGVANYLIEKCLAAPSVPDWIKAPYKRILADEEGHGSGPEEILERYATTPECQDATRRAVAMRLVLMREYLGSLDRWAMNEAEW
jgi:hypothetical protein